MTHHYKRTLWLICCSFFVLLACSLPCGSLSNLIAADEPTPSPTPTEDFFSQTATVAAQATEMWLQLEPG